MRAEPVWLETTDPLAVVDIPAFCSEFGHRLVEVGPLLGQSLPVERGSGAQRVASSE